jgi:hypothetical protein
MPQAISDFFTLIGWLWQNTTDILGNIFLPVRYIYTFLKQFLDSAFSPPITPETIWAFDDNVIAVFHAIPYFDVLLSVLMIAITITIGISLLKSFQRS